MEDELGVKLLNRTSRVVTPAAAGLAFAGARERAADPAAAGLPRLHLALPGRAARRHYLSTDDPRPIDPPLTAPDTAALPAKPPRELEEVVHGLREIAPRLRLV